MSVKVAAAVLTLLVLAAFGVNYWLTSRAVTGSQHRWCATIELLTRTPVPRPSDAAASPSRETSWRLYEDFVSLGQDFGCHLAPGR